MGRMQWFCVSGLGVLELVERSHCVGEGVYTHG